MRRCLRKRRCCDGETRFTVRILQHRWITCPPSARLCENYEDTGSEYAQQGTDAHSLCEHKLKLSLGMDTSDPTAGLSFYDEEMEECACGYAEYVLSLVEEASRNAETRWC